MKNMIKDGYIKKFTDHRDYDLLKSYGAATFDPAEWTTTNDYLLAVSAADNSTSDIFLKDSTGATTYATLNNPDNYATTTFSCIPSSSTTWDTNADTNGNDVYSVRVLVQVGGTGTSVCGASAVLGPPRVLIKKSVIIKQNTMVK